MSNQSSEKSSAKRIVSIDQLRGYAIFGMLIVNAKGLFFEPVQATLQNPDLLRVYEAFLEQISHHKTIFTYADTIAPLFVFVVGMGMRLSWLRRSEIDGDWPTRKAMIKRNVLLILISFALYAGWIWDALMHIGISGLLAVAFIDKKPRTRIIAAFAYLAVYQAVYMLTSYGTWSVSGKFSLEDPEYVPLLVRLIPLYEELFAVTLDGGLLGSLSWVMMLLFGSVAYDVMMERNDKKLILTCLGWGVGLCAAAYLLHMEWPGVKEAWPISKRYATAPFPLWSTGLCFFQLLAFYIICDKLKLRIPTFTAVGMNPLVIYIAQSLFLDVAHGFEPERLSMLTGFVGFAVFWAVFAGAAYYMQRNKIFIKI